MEIMFDSTMLDAFVGDANELENVLSKVEEKKSTLLTGELLGSSISKINKNVGKTARKMGRIAGAVTRQKEAMTSIELALLNEAQNIKIYNDYDLSSVTITNVQKIEDRYIDKGKEINKDNNLDEQKLEEFKKLAEQTLEDIRTKELSKQEYNDTYSIEEKLINGMNKSTTEKQEYIDNNQESKVVLENIKTSYDTQERSLDDNYDNNKIKLEDVIDSEDDDYLYDDFYYEET